jgi:Tol biopolymer transport system component
VISTDGGPSEKLFETPGPDVLDVGGWTHDGRQILFVRTAPADAERGRQGELWAVSVDGGAPRRLGISRPALRDVRVSPDGSRIAFTTGFPDEGLWIFENFLPGMRRGRSQALRQ